MSPQDNKYDNNKLLFAVCGLVVAGAAGLAIIAGAMANRDASTTTTRTPVTPAVHERVSARRTPVAPPEIEESNVAPVVEETTAAPAPEPIAGVETPVFDIDPDADLIAEGLGAYHAREFGRAAAYLGAECERRPDNAWTRYMHGLSLWKSGRADAAADAMVRATELNPESIKAWVNLSRIQNYRGGFDAALAAADAALALQTDDTTALFLRGRSLRNLGRIDEAIDSLEQSLAVDADNGFAGNLLGLTFIEQARFEDAARVLERAAVTEPEVAYIQNNLGMALEHVGRGVEAVAAYGRGVELDAAYTRAATNLARLEAAVGSTPVVLEDETVELAATVEEAPRGAAVRAQSGLMP